MLSKCRLDILYNVALDGEQWSEEFTRGNFHSLLRLSSGNYQKSIRFIYAWRINSEKKCSWLKFNRNFFFCLHNWPLWRFTLRYSNCILCHLCLLGMNSTEMTIKRFSTQQPIGFKYQLTLCLFWALNLGFLRDFEKKVLYFVVVSPNLIFSSFSFTTFLRTWLINEI